MSKTYVFYCVTENYLDIAWGHVRGSRVMKRMGTRPVVVCHGFRPTPKMYDVWDHCDFVHQPTHWAACMNMLQHGGWLESCSFLQDDDIVILLDGDCIPQRDFSDAEWANLQAIDGNTVVGSWNGPDGDSLWDEAHRMGPVPLDQYGGGDFCKAVPCINCGVLAMRVSAWKSLRAEYEAGFLEYDRHGTHRCKIQWFVCYCIHRAGIKLDVWPRSFHCHGHFGHPPGLELRPEWIHLENPNLSDVATTAYFNNEKVLFRHFL